MGEKDSLKDLKKRIAALALAGGIAAGGVAVGASTISNKKDLEIGNEKSIQTTLEDVASYTSIDDYVATSKFTDNQSVSSSWTELNDQYMEARISEDAGKCNDSLFKIGYLILKASVSEQVGIDFDKIVNVKCELDEDTRALDVLVNVQYMEPYQEQVAGNIILNKQIAKEKTFRYKGESYEFIKNILLAKRGKLKLNPDEQSVGVDDAYRSYQRYILSSGTLEETLFGKYPIVDMELDETRVSAFKK